MSINTDFLTTLRAIERLEKEFSNTSHPLNELYCKRKKLVQKESFLITRISPLAKPILEKVQLELAEINKEISRIEQVRDDLNSTVKKYQKELLPITDEVSAYINDQCVIMAKEFFDYVKNHTEDLALNFRSRFSISSQMHRYENGRYKDCLVTQCSRHRHGTCLAPTGNIGIYDDFKNSFIVLSNNFEFNDRICDCKSSSVSCECRLVLRSYEYTNWYEAYILHFTSLLLEYIENNYPYNELFKLTIDDSYFTLELA